MVQEILTYLVVAWAFYQLGLFFWRIIKPAKGASGCGSGGCASCDAKTDLFDQIKHGKYPKLMEDKVKS